MTKTTTKTLVVGPAWVGDMVMSQTLYQLLKQRQPEQEIHVLAPPWSRPLLERMPQVSHSIDLPIGHGQWQWQVRRQIAQQLAAEHYQHAYVLPNSWKSAWIPFLAQIPVRTGWRGEMRWGLLNDVRYLDKQQYPLMIERFMALALTPGETLQKPYPIPQLMVDPTVLQTTLTTFNLSTAHKVLALCPGAEFGPAKRWPQEHYAAVARHYLEQGWQVWIFGSKNDAPVAEQIQQLTEHRCLDFTGQTTLGQAIDLLSVASAVVTNDSGLMHIAAALQRPLVAVYGSSDPGFTPPLHQQVKMIRLGLECSPCFKRECPLQHLDCLQQLQPKRVLNALTELTEQ